MTREQDCTATMSPAEAWDACQRPDSMISILEQAGLCRSSPALHEAGCRFAERALLRCRHMEPQLAAASWAAIKAKRRWLAGEVPAGDLSVARVVGQPAHDAAADEVTFARAAARSVAVVDARSAAESAAYWAARAAVRAARPGVRAWQSDLLRQLMGNPFRAKA